MARRNRTHAARRRARTEYAVVVDGLRTVINESYFIFLLLAGVVKRSRRGQQLTLLPGWSFRRETIDTENNDKSASKEEWVLRRRGESGQEIVLSDAALISFLGVMLRRLSRLKK